MAEAVGKASFAGSTARRGDVVDHPWHPWLKFAACGSRNANPIAETHKLRKGMGSTWNPRRNRETREKRLGEWRVTARQEPRPTGRAAVTGWLGSWALFRQTRMFLAADEVRMESVLRCEFF